MTNLPPSFVSTSGVLLVRDDKRDRELLADLAAGNRGALGGLYDRHGASLFRHALALSRRQTDAEDLVQAVFLKLASWGAESPNDLLRMRTPASYLHRMLHTTWVDSARRTTTGERVLEQIAQIAETTTLQAESVHSIDLTRALDALPAAQREVIVLHLVEGFSFREVGRLTGVSLFTSAARFRLAVNRLRRTLGDSRTT